MSLQKVLIAFVAGVLTGLPQGLDAQPLFNAPIIPTETISIILVFGIFGGIAMGVALIKERHKTQYRVSKYLDLYTYFLVGVLCIAIPTFIQNFHHGWQSNTLLTGYFFGSVGLGLLIGGAAWYAFDQT